MWYEWPDKIDVKLDGTSLNESVECEFLCYKKVVYFQSGLKLPKKMISL